MKNLVTALSLALVLGACDSNDDSTNENEIPLNRKDQVVGILNSIESGDTDALKFISPDKYIQHNLSVGDGRDELENLITNVLPRPETTTDVKRVFQDGDFVFAHVESNFFGPKGGFDVYRYENGLIVEHWDNLQETTPANPSGRTLFDGETTIKDLDKTEENKSLVSKFITDIFINEDFSDLSSFFDGNNYLQHNPNIGDGVTLFETTIKSLQEQKILRYNNVHMLMGEGNFVLILSEGELAGEPTAFYDLFRVENGKIAEHWDILETIPPMSEWQNSNGKF